MAKADTVERLSQVQHTFTTMYKGVEVTYLEGEVVHPDDPLLKKLPEHFGPLKFPHDPDVLAALPEPEPPPPPEIPDATPEERLVALVEDHTRAELDDLATEVGITDPAALPNKQAVAEAIVGVPTTEPAPWTTAAMPDQA